MVFFILEDGLEESWFGVAKCMIKFGVDDGAVLVGGKIIIDCLGITTLHNYLIIAMASFLFLCPLR